MRNALLICFTLLAFSSYGQSNPGREKINMDSLFKAMEARKKAAVGKQFPEFFTLLNNKAYSNKDLKGKVVFVNLWFAACAPCIAEFEALNNLYDHFKTDSSFEFISFTFEDSSEIASIKQQYHIQYNIFSVTHSDCERLNFRNGFPTNIVLDKSGTITWFNSGGEPNKHAIEKYFSNKVYPFILKEL